MQVTRDRPTTGLSTENNVKRLQIPIHRQTCFFISAKTVFLTLKVPVTAIDALQHFETG